MARIASILLAALLMLAHGSASGGSAWVLWANSIINSRLRSERSWQALEGYETKQECESMARRMTSSLLDLGYAKTSDGWVLKGPLVSITHSGFSCFPDTTDPRPAKGDADSNRGAWIMWSHLSSDNPAAQAGGFWRVTLSTSAGSLREKEVCERAAQESTREWTDGRDSYRQRFVCLPDSIDPRGPMR